MIGILSRNEVIDIRDAEIKQLREELDHHQQNTIGLKLLIDHTPNDQELGAAVRLLKEKL